MLYGHQITIIVTNKVQNCKSEVLAAYMMWFNFILGFIKSIFLCLGYGSRCQSVKINNHLKLKLSIKTQLKLPYLVLASINLFTLVFPWLFLFDDLKMKVAP